jgi:hypothetical protein
LFCSDDCRSWPRDKKINNHGCWGKHTHSWQRLLRNLSVSYRVNHFFGAIILMWYTRNIFVLASNILFINWTVRMSDNLPERVQILGHVHIICITVWENRIIFCQIFCDLLLKTAFEWIFNVMQLILFKIKWHIKWKYLIKKFHDICLSYYFKFIFLLSTCRCIPQFSFSCLYFVKNGVGGCLFFLLFYIFYSLFTILFL